MPVLEVEGLTKSFRSRFSRKVVEAVKGLDISVEAGSVVAFVGPNGAGKTTTLLAILGLLKADSGTISLFGERAGSLEARSRLGYQSEIFYTYPFHTARRALRFFGRLSGMTNDELRRAVDVQLEQLGIAHAADRKISTFSKGMVQRLGLAQALLHGPELLLLDEPTTGLDPEGRKLVADIIAREKEQGRTVFLSSHILTDVERSCDRVIMIRKGELVLTKELGARREGPELWEVELSGVTEDSMERLALPLTPHELRANAAVFRCSREQKAGLFQAADTHGLDVTRVQRCEETLEALYMRYLGGSSDG